MMKKHKNSGFTLIELLVVITIILILAAILFPVFAAAREKAIQNNCLSNLKNIGTAIQQYTTDHDDYMLRTSGQDELNNNLVWYIRLMPYLTSKTPSTASQYPDILSCPSVPELAVAYGMNYRCNQGVGLSYPPRLYDTSSSGRAFPVSGMRAPASTIFICEVGNVPTPRPADPKEYLEIIPTLTGSATKALQPNPRWLFEPACFGGSPNPNLTYVPRHNGGTNCLMVDGHVKWYPIEELHKWKSPTVGTVIAGQDNGNGIPERGEPGCPWDNVPD